MEDVVFKLNLLNLKAVGYFTHVAREAEFSAARAVAEEALNAGKVGR